MSNVIDVYTTGEQRHDMLGQSHFFHHTVQSHTHKTIVHRYCHLINKLVIVLQLPKQFVSFQLLFVVGSVGLTQFLLG